MSIIPELFNGLITLAVGAIALLVYWLNKRSEKQSAATIVVMDIRHAESVVSSILEIASVNTSTKDILIENNWTKYKHLFAKDFSQDDFAAFNRFFDSCADTLDATNRVREMFYWNIQYKTQVLQQKLFEIDDLESAEGEEKKAILIKRLNSETTEFKAAEPQARVMQNLKLMGQLSNTIAFEKLKKKAGMK